MTKDTSARSRVEGYHRLESYGREFNEGAVLPKLEKCPRERQTKTTRMSKGLEDSYVKPTNISVFLLQKLDQLFIATTMSWLLTWS